MTRYPRHGQPLMPGCLRPYVYGVVEMRVPGLAKREIVQLRDADESCWMRFGDAGCAFLAEAISIEVAALVASRPPGLLSTRLPRVSDDVAIGDLVLQTRTYNCLVRNGFFGRPALALSLLTIADVLRFRGFGAKCLLDLLLALESHSAPTSVEGPPQGASVAPEVAEELTELIDDLPMLSAEAAYDVRIGDLLRRLEPRWQGHERLQSQLVEDLSAGRPLEEIRAALTAVVRESNRLASLPLEKELAEILRSVSSSDRNSRIAARLWGWDGWRPKTLQEVGKEFGLTRERVRQIALRIDKRLRGRPTYTPILDRALSVLFKTVPDLAKHLRSKLVEHGITSADFDINGLLSAAGMLKGVRTLLVVGSDDSAMVVEPNQAGVRRQVLTTARKLVSKWGIAHVDEVASRCISVDASTAREILVEQPMFSWLDEGKGCFWLKDVPRNALITRIRKTLTVTPTLSLADLRRAVARHYRAKGCVPTRRALAALCGQIEGCSVVGDQVAIGPSFRRASLTEVEATLVGILRDHGGLMDRQAFEDCSVKAGVNRSTFYVYIGYSPMISQYYRGVYGLPGVSVPPGLVESLHPRRKSGRVLRDYGWVKDGRIWIVFHVSKGLLGSGTFSIPAPLTERLSGEYELDLDASLGGGRLVFRGYYGWGLKKLLDQAKAMLGDYLVLVVDPVQKRVTARLQKDTPELARLGLMG